MSYRREWLLHNPLVYATAGLVLIGVYREADNSRYKSDPEYRNQVNEFYTNKLIQRGVLGELPLVDLSTRPAFNQLPGKFVSGIRVFDGVLSGKTTPLVQFAWKSNTSEQQVVLSQYPLSRIERVRTKGTVSTVNFDFDEKELRYLSNLDDKDLNKLTDQATGIRLSLVEDLFSQG